MLADIGTDFWKLVEKAAPESCWRWLGRRQPNGYAKFKDLYAHRVAYELVCGPIPEGMQLDHLCRKRDCVNPGHLEPVTQRENILRGIGIPAVNAKKTFCVHGHPYTPENTFYWRGKNRRFWGRHCRICYNITEASRRLKLRLAGKRCKWLHVSKGVQFWCQLKDGHTVNHVDRYGRQVCRWKDMRKREAQVELNVGRNRNG